MFQLQPQSASGWASATAATAAASLDIANGLLAANLALCDTAMRNLGTLAGTIAAPGAQTEAAAGTEPILPAWKTAHTNNMRSSRSWYRAPYRSPFDPLFWMAPGHPVDHAADWMASSMALAQPGWWQLWGAPSLASVGGPGANVIDFQAAFAAYRSAGGHAMAQVAPAIGQRVLGSSHWDRSWPLPFPLSLWIAR